MSGNDVTLSFEAPNTHKKHAGQIVDLVNSHLLTEPAQDHVYEVDKRQHTHTFVFADIDTEKLEGFFSALNAFDAKKALLTCWYGQVGETEYYAMIRGRLLHFDNLQDYQEASEKAARSSKAKSTASATPSFDFRRPGRDDSLLVRLRVKGKKRQNELQKLFSPLMEGVTHDHLSQFEDAFSATKDRDGEKRLRCHDGTITFLGRDDAWHKGPEHLMKSFVFVSGDGDYLYLGFDMRRLGWEPPAGSPSRKERTLFARQVMLENLTAALGPVFFVSDKSWAKYRPDAENEIFVFPLSEEYMSTLRPATSDDEWNLPG